MALLFWGWGLCIAHWKSGGKEGEGLEGPQLACLPNSQAALSLVISDLILVYLKQDIKQCNFIFVICLSLPDPAGSKFAHNDRSQASSPKWRVWLWSIIMAFQLSQTWLLAGDTIQERNWSEWVFGAIHHYEKGWGRVLMGYILHHLGAAWFHLKLNQNSLTLYFFLLEWRSKDHTSSSPGSYTQTLKSDEI